jgi:hypothetical protein
LHIYNSQLQATTTVSRIYTIYKSLLQTLRLLSLHEALFGGSSASVLTSSLDGRWLAANIDVNSLLMVTNSQLTTNQLVSYCIGNMLPTVSSIVAHISVAMVMCLSSHYQEMAVFVSHHVTVWSQATDWTCGELGFNSPQGKRFFFSPIPIRSALVSTHSPMQWVPGAHSPEVKRLGHTADH